MLGPWFAAEVNRGHLAGVVLGSLHLEMNTCFRPLVMIIKDNILASCLEL